MAKRRDPQKFILTNAASLPALARWVRGRHANTYNDLNEPSNVITIGYDTKPDSDWGRYKFVGRVIITAPELIEAARACIRKAVGWPPKEDTADD